MQKYNKENGTKFKIVPGDTQLKAPVARTVARQFVSDSKIMAVIGASESQAVIVERQSLREGGSRVDLRLGDRAPT